MDSDYAHWRKATRDLDQADWRWTQVRDAMMLIDRRGPDWFLEDGNHGELPRIEAERWTRYWKKHRGEMFPNVQKRRFRLRTFVRTPRAEFGIQPFRGIRRLGPILPRVRRKTKGGPENTPERGGLGTCKTTVRLIVGSARV